MERKRRSRSARKRKKSAKRKKAQGRRRKSAKEEERKPKKRKKRRRRRGKKKAQRGRGQRRPRKRLRRRKRRLRRKPKKRLRRRPKEEAKKKAEEEAKKKAEEEAKKKAEEEAKKAEEEAKKKAEEEARRRPRKRPRRRPRKRLRRRPRKRLRRKPEEEAKKKAEEEAEKKAKEEAEKKAEKEEAEKKAEKEEAEDKSEDKAEKEESKDKSEKEEKKEKEKKEKTYDLVFEAEHGGKVALSSGSKHDKISKTVKEGKEVRATAYAKDGYKFKKWTKNGHSYSSDAEIEVKASDAKYVAWFEKEPEKTEEAKGTGEDIAVRSGAGDEQSSEEADAQSEEKEDDEETDKSEEDEEAVDESEEDKADESGEAMTDEADETDETDEAGEAVTDEVNEPEESEEAMTDESAVDNTEDEAEEITDEDADADATEAAAEEITDETADADATEAAAEEITDEDADADATEAAAEEATDEAADADATEAAAEEITDEAADADATEAAAEGITDEAADAGATEAAAEEITDEAAGTDATDDLAATDIAATEEPAIDATDAAAIAATEAPAEVAAPVLMPGKTFRSSVSGMTITVVADEGTFPEGTQMRTTYVSPGSVMGAVEGAVEGEIKKVKAVDISFRYKDKEIQPEKSVRVTISASGMDSSLEHSIMHINDHKSGVVETVVNKGDMPGTKGSFEADSFSIYVVVEEDEPSPEHNAVATYKFYVGDELKQTQYVKNGDKLADPGDLAGDGANKIFKGWFIRENGEITDRSPEFGTELTGIDEEVTIEVAAKVEQTYYVTFWGEKGSDGERGIVQVKSVTVIGEEGDPGTVSISDVNVTPKADTSAFEGWSRTDGGEVITDDEIEVTGRVNLYAVVVDAHWIHFDENIDYETSDSDATYTGPVAVKTTEKRADKKPADPTRRGYQFGGWYEEAECTNAFDWSETGLESDITLYAKWVPDEADYTVIIWKQKVTDAKDAAESARTYDFESNEELTGTTGETLDPADFDDYTEYTFTGFHYGRTEIEPATVKADGSTVVNVYYDRNLLTIYFYDGTENVYTETTSNNGTQYGLIEDEYFSLTRHGNGGNTYWTYQQPHEYSGTTYSQATGTSGTQYGFSNGQMQQLTYVSTFLGGYWQLNGRRYNGTRYWEGATGNNGYGVVDGSVVGISHSDDGWTYTVDERYTGTRYVITTEPKETNLPAFTGRPLRPTIMTGLLTGPGTRTRMEEGPGSRSLTLSSLKDCQERVRMIRSSHSTARTTPVPTTSGSTNRTSTEAIPTPPPIPYSPLRAEPLRSRRSTRASRRPPTGTAPAAGTIPAREGV